MSSAVTTTRESGIEEKKIEQYLSSVRITPGIIKIFCGVTAGSFLGLGIRSARKYTRGPEGAELGKVKLVSGVAFASRALATATLITFSGFGLLVIGVSAILNVNTPRQFGAKVQNFFGDRFRLNRRESIASLSEVLRHAEISSAVVERKEDQSNHKT